MIVAALAGAPLTPGRDEAADLARRELSDRVYAEASPGLLQRGLTWLLDRLSSIQLPEGAPPRTAILIVLIVVAVLVAAAVLTTRGQLRARTRARGTAVFEGTRRSAREHRAAADAAATDQDWDTAVRERFRAVVASLEERTILDERPGRTAVEVGQETAPLLPEVADRLHTGARIFDDVCYGGRPGDGDQDQALRDLDEAIGKARPSLDRSGGPGVLAGADWAVPTR